MSPEHIELTYTALAQCLARVGETKAPLLLATLALDLLSQLDDAGAALEHIQRAERLANM
jgi:hypothetical protein